MPDNVRGLTDRIKSNAAPWLLASGLLTIAGCAPPHPGVEVVNDLGFPVALSRCESKSVAGADPIFIAEGKVKTIHPGATCIVNGPTTRFGPSGSIRAEGPYVGCLRMPRDSERSGVRVYVSSVERNVGLSDCDRALNGERAWG